MKGRYTHESRNHVKRVLDALLAPGLECNVLLLREGWEMQITVCGAVGCEPYTFGPGIQDYHLIRIANQWKTGERMIPDAADRLSNVDALGAFADNAEELKAWARNAKRGQRVVYFIGNLAQFRSDAPKEIVALQSKGDSKISGNGSSAAERFRVTKLQVTLDLLDAVATLNASSLIDLVQMRMTDGFGYTYYAVRR